MQIVITLSEDDWSILKPCSKKIGMDYIFDKAIELPEHHGRLGDLDALEEYFKGVRKQLKASDYKNGIEFFVRDEMLLNVQQFIHLCDAIIEGSESE